MLHCLGQLFIIIYIAALKNWFGVLGLKFLFTGITFIFFVLFLTAVSASASSSKEDRIKNTKGKMVTLEDKTRKLEIKDTFRFCFVHILYISC